MSDHRPHVPGDAAGETPLPGGFVNQVVRAGETVRRSPSARTRYVAALLTLLDERGWPGAPRHLGWDERGREVLTYVEGEVPWGPDSPVTVDADASLVRVARMVREFHDLTAGTALADGGEVVCHNDLSPKNTVYRPGPAGTDLPVAFLDWDIAAPGARVHDVAHLCWQYLALGPGVEDVAEAARRMRLVCDAYQLAGRRELVPAVLWWQERCWRGIESAADHGDPAMVRLRELGVPESVRAAAGWVAEHRGVLERTVCGEGKGGRASGPGPAPTG